MAVRRSSSVQELVLALDIPQLLLGHAEVVPQFVYQRLANLMANFSLVRTDRFDILLVKHDVVRPSREVEDAFLGSRNTMKDAQKQSLLLTRLGWSLVARKILDEDRDVMNTAPKFFWERLERVLNNFDKSFAVHFLPAEDARNLFSCSNIR